MIVQEFFWSFGNDTARNVITFGVDNSSSSHSGNSKNNVLILNKCPTFEINGSFGAPEKTFGISLSKANTKFCLRLHYNGDNNYLFVNGKEIFKFKADNKNVKFPTQFCLRFGALEFREVSLTRNVSEFSVDYNSIAKSDILNIHKYLKIKKNIKCSS